MFWSLELVVALIVTIYFIKREKPNVLFLFYGYIFFLVSLLFQLPFRYVQVMFMPYLEGNLLPLIVFTALIIVVVEVGKYFSLRRFLKTRSFKNGILFGIGWATFESINMIKVSFFDFVLSFFLLSFDVSVFLKPEYAFLTFVLFFFVNVATTVLIVLALIKKNLFYLIYAILFNIVIIVGYGNLEGIDRLVVGMFGFIYSVFIVFHYRKIK